MFGAQDLNSLLVVYDVCVCVYASSLWCVGAVRRLYLQAERGAIAIVTRIGIIIFYVWCEKLC